VHEPILPLGNYVSAGVVRYLGTEKLIGHANFPNRSLDFCRRDMFGGSIPLVEFRRKIALLHRGAEARRTWALAAAPAFWSLRMLFPKQVAKIFLLFLPLGVVETLPASTLDQTWPCIARMAGHARLKRYV
jgi:hypothetical protein